jgi:hypothetical protein
MIAAVIVTDLVPKRTRELVLGIAVAVAVSLVPEPIPEGKATESGS